MYKVMVVDDEQWGRKAICKLIEELSANVEVVAEAKHGEEALQLLQYSKPHIVVTDMNMPVMDGKQFLENLFRLHKEIKVIVISGYSEFEYLKAALTYQVCDYVLKPVSILDLKNAITKAIETIQKDVDDLQQQYHANSAWKLKREVFLQHVSQKRISNQSDMAKQLQGFKIVHAFEKYRMVMLTFRQFNEVAVSKFHGNADLLMFSLENILSDILKSDVPLMFTADDRMKLCVIMPSAYLEAAGIGDILGEFQHAVLDMLKVNIVAGISRAYERLETLPAAYDEALTALWNNKFHISSLFVSTADSMIAPSHAEILTIFDLKTMKQAFVNKNEKVIQSMLEHFLRKIALCKDILIQEVHFEYIQLSEIIASGMKEISYSNQAISDFQVLQHVLDIEELTICIHKLSTLISEAFLHLGDQDSSFPVHEITNFLSKHYFEELSLVDVAMRFHLDPSYFSKLFKAFTNENFIEYLTRLRMEKACELLSSSDRKVNEIAELIGYENQRYFSQVFKKFTGQTPTEYRESSESV
ncbi:two-component system response regulator YesN [Paenibacillus sp. V4I3]|uniref:response regulator n=1 Tax=Paenibacillus sp. V4I3 TaxID=3042305 RepID=UPI002786CF99|nr:response regulator [Paenibacillus sp. V4I3]MDQ0877829.1 two-component system response regulator YesN [Paenibacillus sp. V4I3]